MSDQVSCLVTGASGFLGRHLVAGLQQRGYDVSVLGRRAVDGCTSITADLEKSGDLPLLPESFREVFHAAGLAHINPRSQSEADRFFAINRDGSRRLLDALDRSPHPPEALVLISTVAVYGKEEGQLLDEDTPRQASDPYGLSKREAEDLAADWAARRGVRLAVLRLPLVAGKGAEGNLGAMIRAMKQGWYFGVAPGLARRSLVMASDVAALLPEAARTGGIFHLTDGLHPSFAELERAIAAALGQKAPARIPFWSARIAAAAGDTGQRLLNRPLPFNTRALRRMTATLTFSDQRARTLLGWKPAPVLDQVPYFAAA